jgi:diadenosine tetraphosphate (Ap4A) HIT family hydrolase
MAFELDERLQNDSIVLGESDHSLLLLMNNALVPWFILVPKTMVTELHDLDPATRAAVLDEVQQLSIFVKQQFPVDKLNVAAIGNVVSQLHVHVVGRHEQDYCWPSVVWGQSEKIPYTDEDIETIKVKLAEALPMLFRCSS